MNSQLATQSKAVTQCINQSIADDYIRRYQSSTKNALENILCMGEAVNEIYQKVKSKELDNSDLEYFCQSVHLDPKGSTFRKYKAIGENASRFRAVVEKLPPTFSVMYELATLEADDFEFFTRNTTISKNTTLEEFKQMVRRAKSFNSSLHSLPSKQVMRKAAQQVQAKTNHFEFTAPLSIKKSELDEIKNVLNRFKRNGWIRYEEPAITRYENDFDDDEKYFTSLAKQDYLEMRV